MDEQLSFLPDPTPDRQPQPPLTSQPAPAKSEKPFDFSDRYFFDLRFWKFPDDPVKEIELLLTAEEYSNNSGHTVLGMRSSGIPKDELVRMAQERMPAGVRENEKAWLSELNLHYFETYGEDQFKRLYGHYEQCVDWLGRHGYADPKRPKATYDQVRTRVFDEKVKRDRAMLEQKREEVRKLEEEINRLSSAGEK